MFCAILSEFLFSLTFGVFRCFQVFCNVCCHFWPTMQAHQTLATQAQKQTYVWANGRVWNSGCIIFAFFGSVCMRFSNKSTNIVFWRCTTSHLVQRNKFICNARIFILNIIVYRHEVMKAYKMNNASMPTHLLRKAVTAEGTVEITITTPDTGMSSQPDTNIHKKQMHKMLSCVENTAWTPYMRYIELQSAFQRQNAIHKVKMTEIIDQSNTEIHITHCIQDISPVH